MPVRRCRQQRNRNCQRDQRAAFGEHPEKGLWLRHAARSQWIRGNRYDSGIRPQAGRFCAINRASAAAVKGGAEMSSARLLLGGMTFQRPRSRSSTSEEANPSAGAPIEAWKPRSASRVWPPSWPSGCPIEAALRQQLLQFQPLGARQFPLLPRPGLHERRAAAQAVGEMTDRQRIGFRRIVFHDHPEILQHQETGPSAPAGASR